MMKIYECDPEKNTKCRKTGCYLYHGECHSTSHVEYAKDPNKYETYGEEMTNDKS